MINKIIKLLIDSRYRFETLDRHGLYNIVSDKKYQEKKYAVVFKRKLDLKNPTTFNEKLQWLKLYDRKPIYTIMVDKYEAKKYVGERIGEEYIIPNFGVWEHFDDIDFEELPNQFVLKCTHDSGGLVICRDKSEFCEQKAKEKIERSLKRNYYWSGREWPYKDVKPRIIAEMYMEDNSGNGLRDYKFYCFNGEPKFLYISEGLENHNTAHISFVTLDWQFAPYQRSDYLSFEKLPEKPSKFDEMLKCAKALSSGVDFLRVDLYEVNGKIYFSELTFSPCSGYMPFKNQKHDLEIGKLLKLTSKK